MPEFLEGQVDVPAVGKIKKAYILVPAGLAAAYVGWRWYQASQAAEEAPAGSDGLYSSDDLSEYGLSTTGGATNVTGNTGSTTTDGTNPNAIDDNSEWNERAVERLTNSGYDPQTVRGALGEFLARRSLDSAEAGIARAALGAAGQPPEGRPWSVIEAATTGTASPAAPTGLRVSGITPTSVNLSWSTVAGASEYAVYRSDTGSMTVRATGGSVTVYGLKPYTAYSFQVAAIGTGGKVGPKSSSVNTKTTINPLARPATPKITSVTRTSFRATTASVAGATRYRWYLNGKEWPSNEAPYRDFTGLKPNTAYAVGVQADAINNRPGPMSATAKTRTKR